MGKAANKVNVKVARKFFLPVLTFLLVLGLYIVYKGKVAHCLTLALQAEVKKYTTTLFLVIFGFFLQRVAAAVLDWYRQNFAAQTASTLDDELIPFLRQTAKIFIWVIVLLVILPLYGVNISALIAALGVSSLAIALAAQDTISNIIAGFMIMVDRPFRVGDKIKLPWGEEVEVLDIGIRRSKFLLEDKAVVIVPNLELSKSRIVNYTYREGLKKNA